VAEDSNAYAQGIREGDVLLQLGEQKITEESHISSFLENRSIGETFQALIYRKDTDSRITLELTVEQAFS
jgi:S1-C subfamily serine protease